MRFKQFLHECDDECEMMESPSLTPTLQDNNMSSLNKRLDYDMQETFISPESGLLRIRKVLHLYGHDLPALYDADPEGDEFVLDIDDGLSVYILYTLTDNGDYEFYVEVGNETRIKELLSDEGDEEEE